MQPRSGSPGRRLQACFNPHPARRPDATVAVRRIKDSRRVSILTRPEGRMQRSSISPHHRSRRGFNPHPARRPDATSEGSEGGGAGRTFQSSPGPKAGCNQCAGVGRRGVVVSILTRPEGRMQRARPASAKRPRSRSFNPHPARRPDATPRLPGVRLRLLAFQSSPGPKAGCNVPPLERPYRLRVSILTRPEGRMQRQELWDNWEWNPKFQSSPGPKAGCNVPHGRAVRGDRWTVSILTRPEGRMQRRGQLWRGPTHQVSILTRPEGRMQLAPVVPHEHLCRFNPHPARRPGCNKGIGRLPYRPVLVSILTRPEGRMQLVAPCGSDSALTFQSSPGPKAGCNGDRGHHRRCHRVSILTRPEGRMQHTP